MNDTMCDMLKPFVTALIDTYNHGLFIEEAVESALNQGLPNGKVEVLVVDDGSTDDTQQRMEKYAGRVVYLRKANGGQASAFNFGLARARGEIVALLDGDDYWLPGKLRRIVEEFERDSKIGLVYHPLRRVQMTAATHAYEEGFHAISGQVIEDRKKILQYTAAPTSGLCFRMRFLRQLLPLNEAMIIEADAVLAALIIFLAPIVAIPEELGVYRLHGANLYSQATNHPDEGRRRQRIAILKVVIEEIDRWLQSNSYSLDEPEVRALRARWKLLYESEEFAVDPPGRIRFFLHLARAMACMNPCLSMKIQVVNALNALGSLLFGYRHYRRLDEWRVALKKLSMKSVDGFS